MNSAPAIVPVELNWPATLVFVAFFALVTILGFAASRWQRGDLSDLHEWGLGGRRFGAWISWFLIGGDLYTAYTVIAVPALVYASGAYGLFAVPYTILIYPLLYLTFPRLWAVTHRKGYVTAADFVEGRYGNRWLALAVALTGIVATMPYIALQLVGIEKVIQALGFPSSHLPITIAFVILALYTYSAGLRAPALIAFVKDIMIYIFVIAAVVIVPIKLGGYGVIFDKAATALAAKAAASHKPAGILLQPAQVSPFITLAIGSAMALFMYPHSMTGILSSSSGRVIRRNAFMLPAYSFVLGLIAIMGYMAIAAGVTVKNAQDAVPQLFLKMFPGWFAGFAFAGIAIGALVPAAVMSIGAANTFTRNVWKPFINRDLAPAQEAQLAKLVSLIVKVGALLVIFVMPTTFAIDLQLLGGVWMMQVFPAVVFGLFTRWFSGWGLLAGLLVGLFSGTALSYGAKAWIPTHAVWGSIAIYNGLSAFVLNVAAAVLVSLLLPNRASDATQPGDYEDVVSEQIQPKWIPVRR
jgi:SSS family solute:Na+ symporter